MGMSFRGLTHAETSRSFDLSPSDIEKLLDEAKKEMESALRAESLEVKERALKSSFLSRQ